MPERSPVRDAVPFRCGGHDALDFVNTVDTWLKPPSRDYIDSFEKLVAWCEAAGMIDAKTARGLRRLPPLQVEATVKDAMSLRAALVSVFGAVIDGKPPRNGELKAVSASVQEARAGQNLACVTGHLGWEYAADCGPRTPLHLLALSAVDLIERRDLGRLRRCPAPDGCGWLFFDESKNRSRRWCSMAYCGRFAKARRYAEAHG